MDHLIQKCPSKTPSATQAACGHIPDGKISGYSYYAARGCRSLGRKPVICCSTRLVQMRAGKTLLDILIGIRLLMRRDNLVPSTTWRFLEQLIL